MKGTHPAEVERHRQGKADKDSGRNINAEIKRHTKRQTVEQTERYQEGRGLTSTRASFWKHLRRGIRNFAAPHEPKHDSDSAEINPLFIFSSSSIFESSFVQRYARRIPREAKSRCAMCYIWIMEYGGVFLQSLFVGQISESPSWTSKINQTWQSITIQGEHSQMQKSIKLLWLHVSSL